MYYLIKTVKTKQDGWIVVCYFQLTRLRQGFGIDPSSRETLMEIESKVPSLMKSLGFRVPTDGALQWQMPSNQDEFRRLCLAIHGLYRPADVIQTSI